MMFANETCLRGLPGVGEIAVFLTCKMPTQRPGNQPPDECAERSFCLPTSVEEFLVKAMTTICISLCARVPLLPTARNTRTHRRFAIAGTTTMALRSAPTRSVVGKFYTAGLSSSGQRFRAKQPKLRARTASARKHHEKAPGVRV